MVLPRTVVGPRDFEPFLRFASSFRGEVVGRATLLESGTDSRGLSRFSLSFVSADAARSDSATGDPGSNSFETNGAPAVVSSVSLLAWDGASFNDKSPRFRFSNGDKFSSR